jgi:predicted  nucleic acid-binding Zn-ribbon protein
MAKSKELSVEEKLRSLYRLQLIDSRIDNIRNVRGELPLEVEDLEDEVAGLNTRLANLKEEVEKYDLEISNKKILIEAANENAKKYEKQQQNVRNNREFDSLTKEIEFQQLEIQLAEKRIKEFRAKIELKNETITATNETLEKQTAHLEHKKSELEAISKETEIEEATMSKMSEELSKKIDAHLLKAYQKIRSKVKNGLAIVPIERGAAGGSYFTIPPQVQLEIAARKKISIDEYSGRILVDAALAEEEKQAFDSKLS